MQAPVTVFANETILPQKLNMTSLQKINSEKKVWEKVYRENNTPESNRKKMRKRQEGLTGNEMKRPLFGVMKFVQLEKLWMAVD